MQPAYANIGYLGHLGSHWIHKWPSGLQKWHVPETFSNVPKNLSYLPRLLSNLVNLNLAWAAWQTWLRKMKIVLYLWAFSRGRSTPQRAFVPRSLWLVSLGTPVQVWWALANNAEENSCPKAGQRHVLHFSEVLCAQSNTRTLCPLSQFSSKLDCLQKKLKVPTFRPKELKRSCHLLVLHPVLYYFYHF